MKISLCQISLLQVTCLFSLACMEKHVTNSISSLAHFVSMIIFHYVDELFGITWQWCNYIEHNHIDQLEVESHFLHWARTISKFV